MSAFDWSPGGCCCEVIRFYDFYGTFNDSTFPTSTADGQRLVRVPSIYKHPATLYESSYPESTIDWSIPASNPVIKSATSVPSDQAAGTERVWAGEARLINGQYTEGVIALYDAAARTEIVEHRPTTGYLLGDSNDEKTGVSYTHAGRMTSHTSAFLGDPARTDWKQLPDSGIEQTGQVTPVPNYDMVDIVAKRYWPFFCGTIWTPNPFAYTPADFYLGYLDTTLNTITRTVVHAVGAARSPFPFSANSRPRWVSFDRTPSGWAGVVKYNTAGGVHTVAFVNGIEVEHVIGNAGGSWHTRQAHVAHGSGVAAIGMDPSDNFSDSKLKIYSPGGQLLFTSPPVGGGSLCHCFASSDRWLYCYIPNVNVADMPNVAIPFFYPSRSYYLIKHDCSQVVPMGSLDTSSGIMTGWPVNETMNNEQHPLFGGSDQFGGVIGVVHNSELIGNSLPATAEEFMQID